MRKYSRVELVAFLRQLDELLEQPATIRIIGGAAAILAYGANGPTHDIDSWNQLPAPVISAVKTLDAAGAAVPIGPAGVAEIPNDAEDRFRPVKNLGFSRLTVEVPDRYDLALSKTIRGYKNDLETIGEMHARRPFVMKKLVERFESELDGMAAIDKQKLRLNVALLVATLFGKKAGTKVAERWGVVPPNLPPKSRRA